MSLSLLCLYVVMMAVSLWVLYYVNLHMSLHHLYVVNFQCDVVTIALGSVFWFFLSVPSLNQRKRVLYGYAWLTQNELVPNNDSNSTERLCQSLLTRIHD